MVSLLTLAGARPLTAQTPPAITSTPEDIIYTVKAGDTLLALCRQWLLGESVEPQLQALNHVADPYHMPIGLKLRLPRPLLRYAVSEAVVETFSGPVTLADHGQAVGTSLGAVLHEGGEVETGRNAFVTLRLRDGTAVTVPSQSHVRLARLRRVLITGGIEREMAVAAGRLHATVTPMHDPESSFRVSTPLTVSAVRGTDFRIEYAPDRQMAATAVEGGKVLVDAPKAAHPDQLALTPGLGAAITPSGSSGVVQLLPPPDLAAPPPVQRGEALSFALRPSERAAAYRLQITRDEGGRDIVEEANAATPAITLPGLPDGAYFLRASAVDALGLEGLPRVMPFTRQREILVGTASQLSTRPVRLHFSWAGQAAGTTRFHFRLWRRESSAGPVIDRADLTSPSLDLDQLAPGAYRWQVAALHEAGAEENWSAPQIFRIASRP